MAFAKNVLHGVERSSSERAKKLVTAHSEYVKACAIAFEEWLQPLPKYQRPNQNRKKDASKQSNKKKIKNENPNYWNRVKSCHRVRNAASMDLLKPHE